MLVLSRLRNQAIVVGDVRILVVDVRGPKVRLGVEAPNDVRIVREEIIDQPRTNRIEST